MGNSVCRGYGSGIADLSGLWRNRGCPSILFSFFCHCFLNFIPHSQSRSIKNQFYLFIWLLVSQIKSARVEVSCFRSWFIELAVFNRGSYKSTVFCFPLFSKTYVICYIFSCYLMKFWAHFTAFLVLCSQSQEQFYFCN